MFNLARSLDRNADRSPDADAVIFNFERQHEYGSENVLEEAADRFDKYARGFLAENSPELLEWLEYEAEPMAAECKAGG